MSDPGIRFAQSVEAAAGPMTQAARRGGGARGSPEQCAARSLADVTVAQHAVTQRASFGSRSHPLCLRPLGRPASEYGTLGHVDGTLGRGDRLRRSFMLPILKNGGAPLLIPSIGRSRTVPSSASSFIFQPARTLQRRAPVTGISPGILEH